MSSPILTPLGTLEQPSPTTPASGTVLVYAKSDHKLYIKDSTGLETSLTGSTSTKNYAVRTWARISFS